MAAIRIGLGSFLVVALAGALAGALALQAAANLHVATQAATESRPEAELRALLDAQSASWNRGDIEGFMAGYWKSEKTTFAGANGVFRGWQALLQRYHRDYPDRAAMGTLMFSDLEITILAPDAAFLLGQWHLERASGPVGGIFSLVVRKFPEGWRIIHDHTSTVAGAPKKPAT
jgi:ketosteroid isomerase-like protein